MGIRAEHLATQEWLRKNRRASDFHKKSLRPWLRAFLRSRVRDVSVEDFHIRSCKIDNRNDGCRKLDTVPSEQPRKQLRTRTQRGCIQENRRNARCDSKTPSPALAGPENQPRQNLERPKRQRQER